MVSIIKKWLIPHGYKCILGIFIALYIFYFTTLSFLRHDNFYTGRFDLGNMDQVVWNTIHGRIFETTDPNGESTISRLSFHADFILILLSPLYLLWENPKMLLLTQTIILALGSVFVFAIAKNVLRENRLALVLALMYLFNPAVQFTNLYDFHPVTLATTFLLGAFYFLIKNRILLLLIFLVLAGLTKENVWLIVALFGIYIAFINKKKVLGIAVFAISFAVFYSLVSYIIPSAYGKQHFALSFYSQFGDSPIEITKNVVIFPHKALNVILQKSQLVYLRDLFFPLGLLPIFSIYVILPMLPDLLLKLLSSSPPFHQIYYQYSAEITPFLFIGTILSLKKVQKWFPRIPNDFFIYYLLACAAFSIYTIGPLPVSKRANIAMLEKPQKHAMQIKSFLNTIPQSYSVSATNNLGAHLSHRKQIYTIPVFAQKADYVVFLLNDKKNIENDLRFNKNYIQVFSLNDFVAFRKISL